MSAHFSSSANSSVIGAIATNLLAELDSLTIGQPTKRDLLAEVLNFAAHAEHELMSKTARVTALEERATVDLATGLPNRNGLDRAFARSSAFAGRYGEPGVLIRIDILNWSDLCAASQPSGVDALLRAIALRLSRQVRSSDMVARLGPNQFGLLLERCPLDCGSTKALQIEADLRAMSILPEMGAARPEYGLGVSAFGASSALPAVLAAAERKIYPALDFAKLNQAKPQPQPGSGRTRLFH